MGRARDEAPEHADRLRERPDLDVDAPVQPEVIHRAGATRAEHAGGVRVVDHHDGVAPLGDVHEVGERRDVGVHREDAVRDQELAAARLRRFRQEPLGIGGIPVLEHLDLRFRQTGSVDDRRVVQTVAHDHVVGSEDRGDRPGVRREAGLEEQRCVRVLERREPFLQVEMHLHLSSDGPDGAGSGAEPLGRLLGGPVHPRVVRQTEVVVRREVDDLAPVEGRARARRALHRPRVQQQPVRLELDELILQVVERVTHPSPSLTASAPTVPRRMQPWTSRRSSPMPCRRRGGSCTPWGSAGR